MPRRPSGSACRPGRNGKHYTISTRHGMTSARAVGSGVITTRITRARYSCLLRACATAIAASWPARAPTATIGPRRRITEATTARAPSASTRATSTRWATTVAPSASACVVYKTNNIYMKIFKYRLPSGRRYLNIDLEIINPLTTFSVLKSIPKKILSYLFLMKILYLILCRENEQRIKS